MKIMTNFPSPKPRFQPDTNYVKPPEIDKEKVKKEMRELIEENKNAEEEAKAALSASE